MDIEDDLNKVRAVFRLHRAKGVQLSTQGSVIYIRGSPEIQQYCEGITLDRDRIHIVIDIDDTGPEIVSHMRQFENRFHQPKSLVIDQPNFGSELVEILSNLPIEQVLLHYSDGISFPYFLEQLDTLRSINIHAGRNRGRFQEFENWLVDRELIKLRVVYQSITEVPDVITRIESLRELDLSNNMIKKISGKLGNLSNLRRLRLDVNKIGKLPDSIRQLTNVEYLYLNVNRIGHIPSDVFNFPNMRNLQLWDNRLKSLPHTINLPKLEQITLDQNQISNLPSDLSALKQTRVFSATVNNIPSVPDSIGQMQNLEELHLSHNPIDKLPETLGCLTKLRVLNLKNTEISSLPDLGHLPHLEKINIEDTAIDTIPKWAEQKPDCTLSF